MGIMWWLRSLRFFSRTSQAKRKPSSGRTTRRFARPNLEALEARFAPAGVSWTGNAGTLNWSDAGNWVNTVGAQGVPTNTDDVTISKTGVGTINISGAAYAVHSLNDTTAALSIASDGSLSLAAVNASSAFGQNVTIQSGGTLAVGAGASVQIQTGVTLTDNGTVAFASGDAVNLAGYNSTQQILVGNGGLLSAIGSTFIDTGAYTTGLITVNGGGHLTASNSTFAASLNQVYLNNGSILNAGDLTGNTFNCPLFLPENEVQYLSGTGSNNAQFQNIDILSGSVPSGQTLALNAIGTATTANLLYIFPGAFTVASGATLNVAANLSVQIQTGVTLTDNGTVAFASGDAVNLAGYNSTQQILVGNGGLLSAIGSTFIDTGAYTTGLITVNGGGHLTASNSTFAASLNQVYLNNGSILNAGDLTGNTFNCPLFLPENEVQYLSGTGSNNAQFQNIDILSGSVPSGQTLALNAIGTATTANLLYIFPGAFTVASGATLNVAANLSVQIQTGVTLTDNGTVAFASGDAVNLAGYNSTQQILVGNGGLLSAIGSTFIDTGAYTTGLITVNGGGHLTASNSTFAASLNQVYLNNGSILNAGDLTGNTFNCPLFLPENEVQYLSGTGSNNAQFQNIDILSGSVPSGQTLALNAIGTATTANLLYIFPGAFTVASGATLNVAANLSVQIQTGVTLTDNGTVAFASGDAVNLAGYNSTQQILVGNGGLLSAIGSTFIDTGAYTTGLITVNGGGHLTASNSTFAASLNQVYLNNGSILNAGDLTGNTFNCPLFLPENEVQYLSGTGSNNAQFQNIDILSGSVPSGQTLALNAIGTATTANLLYIFPGAFTVASGATLNVAANLSVQIQTGVTLTDNGTVAFASGDAVNLAGYNSTQQILVGNGGLLSAIGSTFIDTGAYTTGLITVNGGHLTANNSTFALTTLSLGSASTDTLQFDTFSSQLAINSGASFTINQNDLTNVPGSNNGIIATGNPSATIDLTNNYWATTVAAQIAAKIKDHVTDSTRPTVTYTPYLSGEAAQSTAAPVSTAYQSSAQNITLSASVTSASGGVNQGFETFTILSGSTTIGSPVTANVSNSVATATYSLPAGTPAGTYTIQDVYSGTSNYTAYTDTSHSLTIGASAAASTASAASGTFNSGSQNVALSVSVTSSAGTVNEGTETFTILSNTTVIGSPVTVNVANGSASANYTLPAGTAAGTYTIQAVYNGTANFTGSTDTSHSLTVGAASSTTAAASASATYSVATQTVTVSASVTSSAGTVNEGTETFTLLSGSTVIGSPVNVNVASGSASASFVLPANTSSGTYTIQAVYNGTGNFHGSSDTGHALTLNAAPQAAVSVGLDSGSNSGAPDHPGFTYITAPQFDVQVNQAGTITIDFDGNAAHDAAAFVSAAGTYSFTAPTLADGAYTATATFAAGASGTVQNTTHYVIDTTPPQVVAIAPNGTANNRVSQALVTFTEPVDLNRFTPSTITLTGPSGTVAVNQPQLVSGSTYSISFPVQTVQGSYSLVIAASVTDFAGNTLGHSTSGSFTIALPDLAVTSASSPSSAIEGVGFSVGWEVANVSAVNPTGGTWHDAVYVSSNPVLDGTAIRIASVAGPVAPLAAGANYSQSVSVAIPGNLASGNYYLLFVANADNGQLEADAGNDTNDVFAKSIAVTAPDLHVTGVSGPATGITGQTVLLNWTDSNSGTAPATGPWVDNVYTTTDAQGDNPTLAGSFTFDGSLDAGASVQRTQQIVLPQTSGTRWFAVVTNATQTVAEGTNSDGNMTVAGTSITITAPLLPDLVVTGITAPPNGVFSGNSVPISFVVENTGAAPTSATVWQDWVILSQDATLGQSYHGQLNPTGTGGDQLLNNQPVIVGFDNPSYLGVGESYQQNVTVPLPLNAQGTWYVYVVPDGTGYHHPFAMPEANRTDKLAISSSFSVTLSPPPDLAVTNVQAPAQDFSGQPINVSWTVTNTGQGPTAASAWTDAVYMSPTATLGANATLLGTFPHQGALASGAHYTNSQPVALPVGVSGSFYYIVKTDLNSQVFENGATANNVAATSAAETVNLTPPPDLKVSSISAPTTGLAGHGFTFSYTVTNGGAGATPNYTWNDSLYLSPTPTFNANTAIYLGQQTHQGSLAAAGAYTNTVTATLPNGLVGTYYVVVATDTGAAVFELDRANNLAASASGTQVSMSPADLVVSAVNAPATALPGSAILVNWTITNQSLGDTAGSAWQDSVYVDTGTTRSANAILLGTFAHHGLLAGGSSYGQSQLVTLPIDLLGSYHLFVVANSSGAVYESNTANNTSAPQPLAVSLQVTGQNGTTQHAAVADLEVTAVTASAVTNGSVTVHWTVQNSGTGTTDANYWDDDIWMSTNATLGSGGTDVYLGTAQHTNPLAAGGGYSTSSTFTVPQTLIASNYYFIVTTNRPVAPPTDPDNEGVQLVYESNATNNDMATSSAAAATPAALADLTVTNVGAANSAMSGGHLAVNWTVTNNGANTGNVPITDSVYLSYDGVYDSTDRYLGSVTTTGGLANGASYTQSANLTLPAGFAGTFYVIVKTNSDQYVLEQNTTNNSAATTGTVQVQLSPPADLVAGTITTPANALAGQNITITYRVTNNGSNPANGSWTDALYLSPTPTWNVSDPLLGQVYQVQNLAPGGSYTGSLTAPMPGVAPGTYYVILRSNILATYPESTLSNNLSASLQQSSINAPALALGTATNVSLNQGQSAYYKVVVSAGQTLQLALTSQNAASHNELYVSYGTMPTRSQYDFRYSQPFQANQLITVPATQAGAYYILAYGDEVPSAPEAVTLEATIVPFSIQTVAPTQAGAGPVTLQINGAQFAFSTTFQLRNGSGTTIDATRSLLQDSATAFATFDLTGKALGAYNVWAIQSDGTSTELAAGLNVVAATPNSVHVALIVPQAVLVGRPGTVTITYSNTGNTDLAAPLILLEGDNVQFQVPGQTCYTGSTLQLYGFNPAGPFGTLQPGFQGSITVSFEPLTAGAGLASNFTLETLQNPSEPFDWSALAANDVPLGTSPQQWAAMVSTAQPLMGATWGDVVSFIGTNSVQLVKNIGPQTDPSALNTLYNFDALLQYAVGVYGTTSPSPTTPSFSVVASNDEVALYNAHVDGSGNALPLDSSYPTFVIVPGLTGYRADYGALAAAIAADTSRFPNGHVNILIATWQGATDGPAIDGVNGPWTAALHVDADGAELGNLLAVLNQQGKIGLSTTTVVGEGLGNDVGNQAAKIAGGLGSAIALDPASALSGYLPSTLTAYFQHSSAYETSSFLDTQLSLAVANQALDTGDINDPIVQHTFGVSWLTAQLLGGNDGVLIPSTTATTAGLSLCGDSPPPSAPTGLVASTATVVQIISHDPNTIIGPRGSGANGLVPANLPLPYTIQFANTPTVPAPAQTIVIKEDIDPPNLDWGTFRLTSFGFDGQTYAIPANSAYYQKTIPLPNQPGYEVQFTATIDESTGLATWTFATIDIATGQTPLDPTVGLLSNTSVSTNSSSSTNYSSISDNNDYGFVSYTILPTQTDPTGTLITAQAAIVFDNQSPLNTDEISNTVDAGTNLSSSVATLPAFATSPTILVSWAGSGASAGSGISTYTIAVSDNGGPYTPWLQNTSLTAAPFVGQDGHTYTFYSEATDNAGNVQPIPSTAQASTEIDATPPTTTGFNLSAPGGSYSPSQWTGTIGGSASDGTSGVAQEQVSILDTATSKYWNGSAFSSSTEVFFTATLANPGANSTTWSLAFPSSNFPADGSYKIHAVATDEAGNVATLGTSATFTYDSVPPTTTDQLAGTTGAGGWFRSAVTVTLSASDATGGVAATYYTIDGGSLQTYTGTAFTVSGEGTHHITFRSVDAAGNTETFESASFEIDTVKPVTTDSVSGTQGSNGWYTSASASVTLNPSDATSGVSTTTYTIDGGSLQTYTGSPFAVSGEGTHHIAFHSVDAAGNTEASESATIEIDTVKPATTDSLSGTQGSNGWYSSGSVNVTLRSSDATSGVATTYYTIDGGSQQTYTGSPFSVSGEGTHHIAFHSVDVAGNIEAAGSDSFEIDSTKPITADSVSGTQGNNGWYTSASVSVALNPSDATSGVAATYYTIDGGSRQTYSTSAFSVAGNGSHQIAFWSVDVAGNTEASESDTIKIDTVKPVTSDRLSGTLGSNGWYTSASVGVNLTGSDATSGIAAIYYTIDGGSQQTYTGTAFPVSGEGTHHITFRSVDVAGNTEAAGSDSFEIDSVKPVTTDSVSGTQGNNGWYTSASASVTLSPSDATSGISTTTYTIDGGSLQTYTGSPFTVSGDGTHQITFRSVDAAGNVEASESATLQIDTVKPATTASLSGTQDSNGSYTSASVSVTLSPSDATSGVAVTDYTIDGGSQQTYTGTAFSVSGEGSHQIAFHSVDVAGNVEATETDTFNITAAPIVSGISPSSGPASGGTTVTITGSNLTGATTVDFGSTAATNVHVVSDTQITATSPAGSAGAVDITVITAKGTSATSGADQFTFVAAPTVAGISPSSGPASGGTTVTITGSNLTGATAVDFGSMAATNVHVVSATQITATSPAGSAGAVDITVITVGGTSTISGADQFTYVAAPTVAGISPVTGPASGATTVTITGTHLTGTTAVEFGTIAATGIHIISDTQITATSPAEAAGAVDITVVTVGGTSSATAADQFTYVSAPTVSGISPVTGPASGGTTVTITGTNLTGATTVDFGSTAATNVHVVSDTQITATSPAGSAGAVDITVITANGTSATSGTDRFTFVAAPTVTGISPTSGPPTGGTTVTITGTNLTGTTAVHFGTAAATSFTVNSPTQITATSPAGTPATVPVTVVTPGGTSTASATDQFTFNIAPQGTIATDTPLFQWATVPGATSYQIYLVDNTTGQKPVLPLTALSGNSYQVTAAQALIPGQSYTWYLGANISGSIVYGNAINFNIAALAAPVQTDESGVIAAAANYDTPTFTWTAVTGANHYLVYVQDTTAGTNPITYASATGTSYTVTAGLTPGHNYTWYVAASGVAGNASNNGLGSTFSPGRAFSLATLAAPVQTDESGVIAAAANYDTPTFTWTAVTGADHYLVYLKDTTAGTNPITYASATGTSYTVTAALTPGHNYTWYVAASGVAGNASNNGLGSTFSPGRAFSLATLAAPVQTNESGVIAAAANYDTPTFTWTPVTGANHYLVYVQDTSAGTNPITYAVAASTSYTVAVGLIPGHNYTWYVAASGVAGNASNNGLGSTFSPGRAFSLATLAAPVQTDESGVIAAAANYDTPTFTWTAVTGADHYLVYLKDTTAGTNPITYASATGTSYTVTAALTPGHNYTWYVAASGVAGNASNNGLGSTFSGGRAFSLAALAAPVQTDESGVIPVSSGYSTPTFTWTAVAGANHYLVYLKDTTAGTNPITYAFATGTSYTSTVALLLGHNYVWYVAASGVSGNASNNGLGSTFSPGRNFTLATS